jgi:hypothetical protein
MIAELIRRYVARTSHTAQALLAIMVLGVASTSFAQEVPPVPNQIEYSILTPGLRMPLNGTNPISLAAGSGAQISYLFAPTVNLPNGIVANVIGVGAFCLGSVNLNPSSISETLSCGPEVVFLNRVSLGFASDLVSGGTNGLTGLLVGKISLANFAPVAFWAVPFTI